MTVQLKSCPKCGGDLVAVRELDGPAIKCMQCGYDVLTLRRVIVKKRREGFRTKESNRKVAIGA